MAENQSNRPVVLCILDGVGEGAEAEHNAVHQAKTDNLSALRANYPHTTLAASGAALGLRKAQVGDGAHGHRILGAGRLLPDLCRTLLKKARDRHFGRMDMVDHMMRLCFYNEYKLHLIGLVSDRGIHSHYNHLFALIDVANFNNIPVIVHAIVDGCDTKPRVAMDHLRVLERAMEDKDATLGTISGRYYAMDSAQHWDRTYKAFHAIVRDTTLGPKAPQAPTAFDVMRRAYLQGLTDPYVLPTRVGDYQGMEGDFMCDFASAEPFWRWRGIGACIMFNMRGDRLYQLSAMFTREVPDEIKFDLLDDNTKPVHVFEPGQLGTLTNYGEGLTALVGYPVEPVKRTLGEVLAENGLRQLRCAESEKQSHVTVYFNGGRAEPFEGEEHKVVRSPQLIDRYEEKPALSAAKIGKAVTAAIEEGTHDFILVQFANAGLLAHTGDMKATVAAVEAVDEQLGRIADAVRAAGGSLLVTSSHGNCEAMRDEDMEVSPGHTHNPVPFIYVNDDDREITLRAGGTLADVAPTVLDMLGIESPPEMTGRSLRATDASEADSPEVDASEASTPEADSSEADSPEVSSS